MTFASPFFLFLVYIPPRAAVTDDLSRASRFIKPAPWNPAGSSETHSREDWNFERRKRWLQRFFFFYIILVDEDEDEFSNLLIFRCPPCIQAC